MKKIGIILRDYISLSQKTLLAIHQDLITYLSRYPLEIICLPLNFNNNLETEFNSVVKTINNCQGIILPGGANYHDVDFKIAKYLHEKNIPTLGICLGMQIMVLAFKDK